MLQPHRRVAAGLSTEAACMVSIVPANMKTDLTPNRCSRASKTAGINDFPQPYRRRQAAATNRYPSRSKISLFFTSTTTRERFGSAAISQ